MWKAILLHEPFNYIESNLMVKLILIKLGLFLLTCCYDVIVGDELIQRRRTVLFDPEIHKDIILFI